MRLWACLLGVMLLVQILLVQVNDLRQVLASAVALAFTIGVDVDVEYPRRRGHWVGIFGTTFQNKGKSYIILKLFWVRKWLSAALPFLLVNHSAI